MRGFGVLSANDLAESDPNNIAERFGISVKTASRWVRNAKVALSES
jgi:transposase